MGAPAKSIDEPRNGAEDVDASRLLSLLSALSQSAKAQSGARSLPRLSSKDRDGWPNENSKPGHRLTTAATPEAPMRDLPRRGVGPDFQSALDEGPPRRLASALPVENRARAANPLGARPPGSRWVIWMLADLSIAGATAVAFSFGFSDELLSRPSLPSHRVADALASGGLPKDGVRPTSSDLPDHGALVIHDQKGLVDHLVPLGISLRGGSGREIVVLDGLVEGTQVSAGTSLSSSRWSLPARDLDQAYIGAPKDFSGTMELSAKLYSPRNDLVQIAIIRLEWGTTSPKTSSSASQPSSPLP